VNNSVETKVSQRDINKFTFSYEMHVTQIWFICLLYSDILVGGHARVDSNLVFLCIDIWRCAQNFLLTFSYYLYSTIVDHSSQENEVKTTSKK
jgi:hypothetical protein